MDGNTALLVAVLTQHLQIISLLLDAGADPSLVNFRLGNAFIEAARIGLTAYVELDYVIGATFVCIFTMCKYNL